MIHGLQKTSEALLLAIVCLAPWAFGSVDAWAVFALGVGIVALTVLSAISAWNTDRLRFLWCAPSLGLAGLVLLGLFQAAPLSESVVRRLAPFDFSFRSGLVPKSPDRVAGDPLPPVPLPAATLSQNPEASFVSAGRLAAAWLLFQAVLGLKDPRSAFRRFGIATAINACLLSIFSIIQWLSWNGKVLWIRESPRPDNPWYSGGPFACHNHLAAYLNLGLGLTLALFLASGHGARNVAKRGARLWPAYGAGLLLAGLFASHSRGGLVAAVAALVLVLLIGLKPLSQDRDRAPRLGSRFDVLPGVALLGLVIVLVSLTFFATGHQSPFARIVSLNEAGSDARWVVWRLSIPAWWDRPIWGAGLGCFGSVIAPYETEDFDHSYARAENEYLDVLVEGGVIGLGLMLVALGGCILLTRRALAATTEPHERFLMLGGVFAGLTLLVHWLFDFSFHIPAVAISAVVLGGFLCRFGLDAKGPSLQLTPARLRGSRLFALALPVMGCLFLLPGYEHVRAEYELWAAGLSLPDTSQVQDRWDELGKVEVERGLAALQRALTHRPDWAEGYRRLGVGSLRRYELAATELLEAEEVAADQLALLSQPLWLREQAYGGTPKLVVPIKEIIEQEPVQVGLVPAARSFLEARRCCSTLPLAHIELACLDYLLEGDGPAGASTRRALRLAGANRRVYVLASILAVQVGDLSLASACWKTMFRFNTDSWEQVADSAAGTLTAEAILRDVIPPNGGWLAIQFADRLYPAPADNGSKARFLRAALERLPSDPHLSPAARLYFQGIAHLGLGQDDQGQTLIEEAVMLEPLKLDWRFKLVELLIRSRQWKAARTHISVGLEMDPGNPGYLNARQQVTEGLVRGTPSVSHGSGPRQWMAESGDGQ